MVGQTASARCRPKSVLGFFPRARGPSKKHLSTLAAELRSKRRRHDEQERKVHQSSPVNRFSPCVFPCLPLLVQTPVLPVLGWFCADFALDATTQATYAILVAVVCNTCRCPQSLAPDQPALPAQNPFCVRARRRATGVYDNADAGTMSMESMRGVRCCAHQFGSLHQAN